MKETPILFTAAMVRAILDGRKTQTRRIMDPQPFSNGTLSRDPASPSGWAVISDAYGSEFLLCKQGKIGDRLWVKETHTFWCHSVESVGVAYEAGGEDKIVDFPDKKGMPPLEKQLARNLNGSRRKRPAIFMHRWASRLTLEITDLQPQKLQSISKEDAIAEGIEIAGKTGEFSMVEWRHTGKQIVHYKFYGKELERLKQQTSNPVWSYESLWESIHGAGSWAKNPWVWAITFKEIK